MYKTVCLQMVSLTLILCFLVICVFKDKMFNHSRIHFYATDLSAGFLLTNAKEREQLYQFNWTQWTDVFHIVGIVYTKLKLWGVCVC